MLPLHHSPMPCSFSTAKHSIAKAGGPVKCFFKKNALRRAEKSGKGRPTGKKPDGVWNKGKIWQKPKDLISVFSRKTRSTAQKKADRGRPTGKETGWSGEQREDIAKPEGLSSVFSRKTRSDTQKKTDREGWGKRNQTDGEITGIFSISRVPINYYFRKNSFRRAEKKRIG